jgi:tRNA A-37 threonylcarbamoyl transferase component Bud32
MNHVHHHHDNPFFNRQRITDPAYYWGRAQEIEILYSAILTHQCRSIVGERKLGKSSLLTHLACPASLRKHGFDPEQFVFIYVDLEGMAQITYDELWPEWLDQLAAALPDSQAELRAMAETLVQQPRIRFMQVRRLMRRIERAGLTVVIMLDEFESLAANGDFDHGFYGELRSLAGELGIVYITASTRSLYDLTYLHADTLSSPFFNIFSEEMLGLLTRSEATTLLQELSSLPHDNPFSSDQINFLIDLAGPHPFFLQVVGYYLYAARQDGHALNSVPELIIRRFKTEAEDHFRYWWQQLSLLEQTALLQLDRETPDPKVLRLLREKALVRQTINGRWQPFSQAFADFLAAADTIEKQVRPLLSKNETGNMSGITVGSYRVLTPIGQGGMAVVYKGYQPALDRYVAIKVMSHTVAGDHTFIERFQREAAAIARLRHQNLVQMLDFGIHKDISYMVMEYISGETLKERVIRTGKTGQRIQLSDIEQIIQDTASALDYAHAHGIIHRDVKPSNIMLRSEERLALLTGASPFTAVLTDFGIARMLESVQLTGTGAAIGTPDYMSPEQAQGEPAAAASDIYALGIVLYEMLTGELPFTADSPLAVLIKHMQARPPLLTSKVPDLPVNLEFVIMKALNKEPQERYSTAGEFADALSKAIKDAI